MKKRSFNTFKPPPPPEHAVWRDESSYERGDAVREPSTFKARIGRFTLTVTRHIHYPPDVWLISIYPIDNHPRESKHKDLRLAMEEARDILAEELRAAEVLLHKLRAELPAKR